MNNFIFPMMVGLIACAVWILVEEFSGAKREVKRLTSENELLRNNLDFLLKECEK